MAKAAVNRYRIKPTKHKDGSVTWSWTLIYKNGKRGGHDHGFNSEKIARASAESHRKAASEAVVEVIKLKIKSVK